MIDVYSNSWGPGDMGFEVEGPGPKLKKVLENGTRVVGITQIGNYWMRLRIIWTQLRTLRYSDYGLRLRLNMLLHMIKTTWLFIFPA